MGGRPRSRQAEIHPGRILPLLAQCQEGRRRYGVALLLEPTPEFYAQEDEGEKTDYKGFGFLYSYLRPYKQLVGQLLLGLLLGSMTQLMLPFLTQEHRGLRHQQPEPRLHLPGTHCPADALLQQQRRGVHTRMDIAASGHTHQHRPNFGLPRQDDEAPHGLLRHQDDGRHPATHQRPHAHTELPDRKQPQRGVLHVQPACFQHCAVAVQRHDIPYLYGRKCVLRGLCLALHEETGRAGPQALCPAERQPEHRSATGERHAGDKAERLRTQKRWEWERIQAKLFKVNIKSLALRQYQDSGAVLINQTKNIVITGLVASLVVQGEMTLGMMLSVQYIIGQLNSPVNDLITFARDMQDARLSMNRLGEVRDSPDEEDPTKELIREIPAGKDLRIEKMSFKYDPLNETPTLDNISLEIASGRQDCHRRHERKRKNHTGEAAAGILSSCRRSNPAGRHSAGELQHPRVAQAVRRGDAGRGHLFGQHCRQTSPPAWSTSTRNACAMRRKWRTYTDSSKNFH